MADGIENDEVVDELEIVGSAVEVIGWARRLERVVFADEAVVVIGRKLIGVGAIVVAVVTAVEGIKEIGGADVVLDAVVDDGVENEKVEGAVVEAALVVVVGASVNDGIA